jgi:hypothetical protein
VLTTKTLVYFEDEAPKIGAGWRLVYATVGRKWVRLKESGSGHKAKLKVETWKQLKRREAEYEGHPH